MVNVVLLGLVSLLTDVSSEMVYPLLPFFLVARLGASPAVVGLIEGAAESVASLLRVWAGYLSDRARRRKPYAVLGYCSSLVGKVVLYLAAGWPWVLVARVVDRFGKGVRSAPRDALIADSSPAGWSGRAFGLHRMLDTAGACLGVLLAYYFLAMAHDNYRPVFLGSIVPAAAGVVLLLLVRERAAAGGRALPVSPDSRSQAAERVQAPREPLTPARAMHAWRSLDRRLKSFLVIAFLFTLGNSSNQFLFLRARDLGFSARSVVLLYLAFNLVYAAASYPFGRLADRIDRKVLLAAGYAVYGLVYLGFALLKLKGGAWILFGLYGLYMAGTDGVAKALIADLSPRERRATVIGLHGTLEGVGLLPASLVAGVLWRSVSPAAPFVLGGITGLAASVSLFALL